MTRPLLKILAAMIQYMLSPQYRKRKKEKEKDKFDEALAEDDNITFSDSLSDSFDRVSDKKSDNNSS